MAQGPGARRQTVLIATVSPFVPHHAEVLRMGQSRSACRGTPRRPLTSEQVLAKGHGLEDGAHVGARLEAAIWDGSQGGRPLAQLLAAPATAHRQGQRKP